MPREKSRTASVVLLAIALAGLGFLLGRASLSNTDPLPQNDPQAEGKGPGPTSVINGVPVGYAASEEGAAAAAYEFSRVMAGGSTDVTDYLQRLTTLAAPEWRERAQELARNSSEFVTRQYGPSGSIAFHPLRYHVTGLSPEHATVEIWGVALATRGGSDSSEESWLLVEIALSWVDGDWRVTGQTSDPGPTPRLLQTNEGPSFDRLEGFEEYGVVSGP